MVTVRSLPTRTTRIAHVRGTTPHSSSGRARRGSGSPSAPPTTQTDTAPPTSRSGNCVGSPSAVVDPSAVRTTAPPASNRTRNTS